MYSGFIVCEACNIASQIMLAILFLKLTKEDEENDEPEEVLETEA